MYRCPEAKLVAGIVWIPVPRGRGRVRVDLRPDRVPLPVSASITTIGSVQLGVAADVVDRRRAGPLHRRDAVQARDLEQDRRARAEPVELLVVPGAIGIPLTFRGIEPCLNATRQPVAIDGSKATSKSLGNGNRHGAPGCCDAVALRRAAEVDGLGRTKGVIRKSSWLKRRRFPCRPTVIVLAAQELISSRPSGSASASPPCSRHSEKLGRGVAWRGGHPLDQGLRGHPDFAGLAQNNSEPVLQDPALLRGDEPGIGQDLCGGGPVISGPRGRRRGSRPGAAQSTPTATSLESSHSLTSPASHPTNARPAPIAPFCRYARTKAPSEEQQASERTRTADPSLRECSTN